MKQLYRQYLKGEGIITKTGKATGKTLAVFCGGHGNELVGAITIANVLEKINVTKGTVHFVFANPPAIMKEVRQINKNLNRCFIRGENELPEEKRAHILMNLLDSCDALLDLHASNVPGSTAFAICEENAFGIVKYFNVPIVSTGWDILEPGATDGYMNQLGKVGICLECGYAKEAEQFTAIAEEAVMIFLSYYGAVEYQLPHRITEQRHIHVNRVIHRKDNEFSFNHSYRDFQQLEQGEIFASDGTREYIAENGDVIIFPHADQPIGAEMCILGKEDRLF